MPTKPELEKEVERLRQQNADLENFKAAQRDRIANLEQDVADRDQRLEQTRDALTDVETLTELTAVGHAESPVVVWGNPYLVFEDPITGLLTNHEISLTARSGATSEELVEAVLQYRQALETLIEADPRKFAAGRLDIRDHNAAILQRIKAGETPDGNGSPVGNFDPDTEPVDEPVARQKAEDSRQPANGQPARLGRPEDLPDDVEFVGWFQVASVYWDSDAAPDDRAEDFRLVVKTTRRFGKHGVLAYSDTPAIPDRVRESIRSGRWQIKDAVAAAGNPKFPPEMKNVAVVKAGEYFKVWAFAK